MAYPFNRRGFLAGLLSLIPAAASAFPGGFLHVPAGAAGGGGGGTGTAIATLSLTNDGAGVSVAGTPTQSFGWLFADNDVTGLAVGAAPQFKVSGVTQPFSASVSNYRTYWPSGRLKFCSFSLRPTFTLAAGVTQSVTILNGGTWPAASSRTLTEVYAQNLVITCQAAPVSGANLSGTWGAWINNTTNAANLINTGALAPSKDMDGDAGARWRLTFKMSQTNGGAWHGQLAFDVYIHALNDSGGNLGGFRWGGCITQPFYNRAGESPSKNWRAFATPNFVTPANGPNWTATGVSATPMPWKGYDNNPVGNLTISSVSGGAAIVGTNNWFLGSSDTNVIPVYFTTTGTLPTPLDVNTIYFAKIGQSSAPGQPVGTGNQLLIYSGAPASGSFSLSLSGGSGVHTVHPVPCNSPFCRTWFLADDAKYLFFKGSGSITAESTLRASIDRTYWQSTGLIPPYDLSLVGSGSITETSFNFPYHPHGIASCQQDADGQTGVVPCLGILPNDCVIDFYKQNARSERTTRCYGFVWSQIPGNFRDATTNSVINFGQPATTYTGLPTTVSGTVFIWTNGGDDSGQAWGPPPIAAYGMGMTSIGSTEHQSNYPLWAWLRTGERQFDDFLREMATFGVLAEEPGSRDTDFPVAGRKGLALSFHNQWRTIAWRFRNLGQAASFCPFDPTNPNTLGVDGTQYVKMLVDQSNLGYLQFKDAMTAANNYFGSHTAHYINRGFWTPRRDFDGYYLVNSPEWEFSYFIFSASLEAPRANNTSDIINFLNVNALRWQGYIDQYGVNGFYGAYSYYNTWGPEVFTLAHVGPTLNDFDVITMNVNGGSVSWTTGHSTDAFTWAGVGANSYNPRNGDIFVPTAPTPAALAGNTAYYIVSYNLSTNKFGLAATPGGTAITMTDSGSETANVNNIAGYPIGGAPSATAPGTDWSNHNDVQAMGTENLLSMRAAMLYAQAQLKRMGVYTSQFNNTYADAEARRINSTGGPYSTIQSFGYGNTTISALRYCYQDHFGP